MSKAAEHASGFEEMEQLTFSAKSFLVIVYEKGIGYRAPILAYNDKALAWAHYLEMVSKYPGDKSQLHLYICGEFDPFSTNPVRIYDDFIEISSDAAADSDYFDHYLIDCVNRFLTQNEFSLYTIALKDPNDPATVLAQALRDNLTGGAKHGEG